MNKKEKMGSIMKLLLCALVLIVLSEFIPQKINVETVPEETSSSSPVSIAVATDVHYISSELADDGALFNQVIDNSDGKVMKYIEEITDSFVDTITETSPDILVLSGDLTFNGAMRSHEDLIAKLEKIQNTGTQVVLIPGNHDLNNPDAVRFTGSEYESVPSLNSNEFQTLYSEFGYQQAVTQDEESLSYLYAVRADLWVLMLDVNSLNNNSVSDKTLKWVEKCLKTARENNAEVIAISHQNLLAHNSVVSYGCQIVNANELEDLYDRYDVLCNLSGHIHMQHIISNNVPEVVTSALPISPHQYGYITYDGSIMQYASRELNVSQWAKDHGLKDKNLLNFFAYSRKYMEDTARRQIQEEFADTDLTEKEIEILADTFGILNADYFSGTAFYHEELHKGISLWKKQDASFYTSYVLSILDETVHDNRSILIKKNNKRK